MVCIIVPCYLWIKYTAWIPEAFTDNSSQTVHTTICEATPTSPNNNQTSTSHQMEKMPLYKCSQSKEQKEKPWHNITSSSTAFFRAFYNFLQLSQLKVTSAINRHHQPIQLVIALCYYASCSSKTNFVCYLNAFLASQCLTVRMMHRYIFEDMGTTHNYLW